jgi:very-short-patch-repair endonuclease
MMQTDDESPIETVMRDCLLRSLAYHIQIVDQEKVETDHVTFFLDFLLLPGHIAIECDGKDFHDPIRDEWRDAVMLGEGRIKRMIRFRGCDIHHHPEDCIYLLSKWHPELFDERKLHKASVEASDTARTWSGELMGSGYMGTYPTGAFVSVGVFGLEKAPRSMWRTRYEFAKRHPGLHIDDLMQKYRQGA